jgi:hypothetical protein
LIVQHADTLKTCILSIQSPKAWTIIVLYITSHLNQVTKL